MNNSPIRQVLEYLLLFVQKLLDLFTLKKHYLVSLDYPAVTNEDKWESNGDCNEVIKPYSIVPYIAMANLYKTVYEELEAHQHPVNVQQYQCHGNYKQVCSNKKMV